MFTRPIGARRITSGALILSTVAQKIGGVGERSSIKIHNGSGASIFVGGQNVTATNGYEILTGTSEDIPAEGDLYGIVAAGTGAITFLELHNQ